MRVKSFKISAPRRVWDFMTAYSSSVSLAGLLRMLSGMPILPMSCISSQLSIEQNYREEKIGEDKHGNDKFRRVPDGFLYRQNIKFEFPNDNDKLSAAIENIMATDVEPKVVFYFKSSSEEEMKNKALAKATADARREAEIVMEAAGTRLGKLIHAQVGEPSFDHGFRNEVMYERKAMDCAKIEFDPEDIDFEEGITLEWEIEG